MARRKVYPPLRVLLNGRLVGYLHKAPGGEISFRYNQDWLDWEHALPVSLSLPLSEDAYRGAPVAAVFDNLLPDYEPLRRRVAEKVGAAGVDAYSLLAAIGRDCVGALQFVADDGHNERAHGDGKNARVIDGVVVTDEEIENLLTGLAQAPLGLHRDDAFRISIAGAQEKTALLWNEGNWQKPYGTTPTTHILKTQIGRLDNGFDLSNSVENEFYCLKLAKACGLPVNEAEIRTFGRTKSLVIERFDRKWARDGRLIRIPQEDCCQALSVPPTRKYQSDGGPGLVEILELLRGSDDPLGDQKTLIRAQLVFWLIGAIDGHAKNFSIALGPGGTYRLTPLYDIVSVQPNLDAGEMQRKDMKLAMSVGTRRHYRCDDIAARHFLQTGKEAGLPNSMIDEAIEEIADLAETAITTVEQDLPRDFPESIHAAVSAATRTRAERLRTTTTSR